MEIDNWVLIGTTLFLGTVALFVPAMAELVKRRVFAPKLRIGFRLEPPACHKTEQDLTLGGQFISHDPVFYFRFLVENVGRSQAKRCEVVLESVARANAAGDHVPYPFSPVSLPWAGGIRQVDINPTRTFFCDLVSIPSKGHQKALADHGSFVEWPDEDAPDLGVVLQVVPKFFSQPNRLPRGKYLLKVALHGENTAVVRRSFKLAWSGVWRDNEQQMFQECVIS